MDLLNSKFGGIQLFTTDPADLETVYGLGETVNGQRIILTLQYLAVRADGKTKTGEVTAVVYTAGDVTVVKQSEVIGIEDAGMEAYRAFVFSEFDADINIKIESIEGGGDATWTLWFDNKRV